MYKNITYLTYVFNLQEVGFIIIRLPRWLVGKQSSCQAGGADSVPELGRCPGEGNDNPLQYSSLGNPMDRGILFLAFNIVTSTDFEFNKQLTAYINE